MRRGPRVRRTIGPWVAVGVATLFFLVLFPATEAPQGERRSTGFLVDVAPINASTFPISHVVFVMLENHPYDNYYGAYCQKLGPNCPVVGNGIPVGTCVDKIPGNASGGCIVPTPLPEGFVGRSVGAAHNYASSRVALDGGLMDGFYSAAGGNRAIMGFYNGTTLPTYWDMAEQFGLGDDFFSSALSYSLPNHWFPLAGAAPPISENPPKGTFPRAGAFHPLTAAEEQYLNDSNATPAIDDELVNSSITWNYYDDSLVNTSYAYELNGTVHGNTSVEGIFDFWNPLISKAESYGPPFASHFVPRTQFLNDTAAGALPDVSWVIPEYGESDHPFNNLSHGEAFVSSLVNAVENSSEWNSTAIFVSWDEYGGYYDHVAPPKIDSYGLGFRVPLLVFSPYTPAGYISHQQTEFESVTHFEEWRFGLGNLTSRDGTAPLPLDYFDLNATPRAPVPFHGISKYPMKEQSQHLLNVSGLALNLSGTGANLTWTEAPGGAPVAGFTVRWGTAHGGSNSANVDRTRNTYAVAGLLCNTSYKFTVTEFAGSSHSPGVTLVGTTGACGPTGVGSGGVHGPLPGGLGERARTDGGGVARSPRRWSSAGVSGADPLPPTVPGSPVSAQPDRR